MVSETESVGVAATCPHKASIVPASGCGILTAFPFAINPCYSIQKRVQHGMRELPVGLGPTHPRPSTVRAEPFSTSVHKDLACVFATTTKICTDGGSS